MLQRRSVTWVAQRLRDVCVFIYIYIYIYWFVTVSREWHSVFRMDICCSATVSREWHSVFRMDTCYSATVSRECDSFLTVHNFCDTAAVQHIWISKVTSSRGTKFSKRCNELALESPPVYLTDVPRMCHKWTHI